MTTNNDIILRVEGLGKRYQLGQSVDLTRNFREALASFPRKLGRIARQKTRQALAEARARAAEHEAAPQAAHDPETPPGTFWALRNVSFEVRRGEVVGIIGRNGAGKSTLLKILSRITTPTRGHAEIRGRLASLLEVGTGFHPELTGRENIYLNGAILGMRRTEIDRKFDEIVAFAEVEKFLDTPVKRYSSGMYVRLAFAVAAHLEPEILVVDEVLAVGDSAFQKKCLGRMDEVAKGGRTVLFVSHNMAAVENLCTRALLLREGLVCYAGAVREALGQYQQFLPQVITQNLSERKDRVGSGKVRVIALKFLNKDGLETQTVKMGSSFTAKLTVVGKQNALIVGIIFGNLLVKQLVRAYSYEQYSHNIQVDGTLMMNVVFNRFPLMHGIYDVHIWLGILGECSDYVENAAELEVEAWDVYGTGRLPDQHGGIAYCKCDWSLQAEEP